MIDRSPTVAREAALCAGTAAFLAALLVWLGPPGADFAAHAYQRTAFLQHGFALWNNFWYAGRYSFITYSLIYYPLAAVLGIKLLAVLSVGLAALGFSTIVQEEWGAKARWSARSFAFVWAGIVLSAAFPFALGMAAGLFALAALQRGRRWLFALLAALTLAASPLSFLLLVVVLAGIGIGRWPDRRRFAWPFAFVAAIGIVEAILWRLFADGGRYPFSWQELLAACAFCILGAAITWRVAEARVLRWVFVAYFVVCLGAFAIPSSLGENVDRLRYLAVPLAVLTFSLRRWQPVPVAVIVTALAMSWNVTPLAWSLVKTAADPAAKQSYWTPAVRFFHQRLTRSYRVEAVDTVGHWDAVYLPRAGVPLARGWFRQNDFPQNRVLYDDELASKAYLHWLRSLGIRYVVLTDAPTDYSSREEAALLRGGRSGLTIVMRTQHLRIYSVPSPRPLVTGPGAARVIQLTQTRLAIRVDAAGTYRIAIRYSPYWMSTSGCLDPGKDSMIRLRAPRAGVIQLRFHVNARRAFAAFAGQHPQTCGD